MGLPGAPKPKLSPARAAAFDILMRVEEGAYAVELLHSAKLDKLSPADRGLTTELVMGVLRWRSQLDAVITRLSFTPFPKLDPAVLTALRLGAYQLRCLERVPAHAAVGESVELVKRARKASAAALVNAVLRKLPKAKPAPPSEAALLTAPGLAEAYAHPEWLVARWIAHYGPERARAICRYNQQVPQAALRLADPAAEGELRGEGVELAPGALLRSARRVAAGDVTHTRAFREGRVAIQDEGSQLVAALVGRGARLLDVCAAPGGKTAVLAAANPQSLVVAAEVHPHRARLMRRLVDAPNVCIVTADARALPLAGGFDRVLADVPCSGTGTLARNPEIKWRLQPEDIPDLRARQVAILDAALEQVAPGGRLVYASCSLEPEENLEVVQRALGPGLRVVPCREELERLRDEGALAWKDVDSLLQGDFLRTLPGVHPCDGFFAAVIERADSAAG